MKRERDSFGDSFLGAIVAIILLMILFGGSPDVADSLRVWIGKQAGIIPTDYTGDFSDEPENEQ